MERQQTQCPNCGSAEFNAPDIDNQVALAMMRNRPLPTVTVTCTHCGSKYQTDASFNMGVPKQPAPQPVVITPAAPEDESSKTNLRMLRSLVVFVGTITGLIALRSVCVLIQANEPEASEIISMIAMSLIFTGITLGLFLVSRNLKKRITK